LPASRAKFPSVPLEPSFFSNLIGSLFIYQQIRANHRIRAREVLVIDPSGKPLGVLAVPEAITAARSHGLDLVEVSPNATPPVCKILDFGKYRYEMAKRDKEAKKNTTSSKVKELKFHMNIDAHDYLTKLRNAEAFMWKGMKVKLLMVFRGREMMHKEIGATLMVKIRADLSHIGLADAEPKLIGKSINMMLTPLPVRKRVRKFTREDDKDEAEDDSAEENSSPETDDSSSG
jgi:translation initiation factor IF-3